jgi:hypothetical protein
MKKTLFVIAVAVAMAFGFTACEDDLGLLGSINLTTSNANGEQAYVDGQTFNFHSAICNVNLSNVHIQYDSLGIDTVVNGSLGAVFVGTTDNLLSAEDFNNITFPLVGINLRDTTPQAHNGNYAIHIPMVEGDFSFIDSLNENNWNYYLTNTNIRIDGEPANIMVIAVSEDEFYVCYDGNIHIDEWATVGNRIQGQVQNVKAFRVTRESLPALLDLPERATTLLSAYLPTVTLNGVISSPRMPSENVSVIEALDQLQ